MNILSLTRCFRLSAADGRFLAALGAGIRLGALAAYRQILLVAQTAVGVDVLQALDVTGYDALQFTLNQVVGIDDFLDA